jgi:hypothetical protein
LEFEQAKVRKTLLRAAWRGEKRNRFPFIPAVNRKIGIDGQDRMQGIKFAHSHEAKIGQVGLAVVVFFGKLLNVGDDEPGIRNSLRREKPLREERSCGPRIVPA